MELHWSAPFPKQVVYYKQKQSQTEIQNVYGFACSWKLYVVFRTARKSTRKKSAGGPAKLLIKIKPLQQPPAKKLRTEELMAERIIIDRTEREPVHILNITCQGEIVEPGHVCTRFQIQCPF